jgi:hypothetical protein
MRKIVACLLVLPCPFLARETREKNRAQNWLVIDVMQNERPTQKPTGFDAATLRPLYTNYRAARHLLLSRQLR